MNFFNRDYVCRLSFISYDELQLETIDNFYKHFRYNL